MQKNVEVTVSTQNDYSYKRVETVGKNFNPDFKPHLTPEEMLELGVFGGCYLDNSAAEFPKKWFKNAKLSKDGKPHTELNQYGVIAGQPLAVWQEKGWIHKDDPKGWFQWYCRYYMGRRHEDDERQIKRWKAIARHASQIVHNCRVGDEHCRPKQRQAILQWAYDPRKL